jgi:hypothetical protein
MAYTCITRIGMVSCTADLQVCLTCTGCCSPLLSCHDVDDHITIVQALPGTGAGLVLQI